MFKCFQQRTKELKMSFVVFVRKLWHQDHTDFQRLVVGTDQGSLLIRQNCISRRFSAYSTHMHTQERLAEILQLPCAGIRFTLKQLRGKRVSSAHRAKNTETSLERHGSTLSECLTRAGSYHRSAQVKERGRPCPQGSAGSGTGPGAQRAKQEAQGLSLNSCHC